eukprot:315969_1
MSKAPSLWNAAQSKYVVQNIRRINVIRVADLEQDASSRLVDLLQSEVAIAKSALSSKLEVNAEANSSNTVSRLLRLESEKLRKLEGLLILVKSELQMIENTITEDFGDESEHQLPSSSSAPARASERRSTRPSITFTQKEKLIAFFRSVNWASVDMLN